MNWKTIKKKVKDHKAEIIITGAGIAATVTVYVIMNRKVKCTVLCNRTLLDQNASQYKEILRLKDLCLEKDEHFKRVVSELLRQGSPMGGHYMSDLRGYPRVMAA